MPDPPAPPVPPQAGTHDAPQSSQSRAESPLADEPSPAVQPIYLRRGRRPRRREPGLRVPDARHDAHASLVDAITAKVLESMTLTLRESIHAAILELAPRMTVGLPEQRGAEDAAPPDAAPLGPPRQRRTHDA